MEMKTIAASLLMLMSVTTFAVGAHLLAPALDVAALNDTTREAVAGLAESPQPGAQFSAATGTAPDAGLIVEPSTALFDTHLWPGESETRLATLTNATDLPLAISLTAVLGEWSGHDQAPQHLMIATSLSAACTEEDMAAIPHTNLASVTGLDHGILQAHTTVPLCVRVELPTSATLPTPATNVVHFEFHTLEGLADPTGSSRPYRPVLAFTGAAPAALVLMALSILMAGIALIAFRRREPSPPPTSGA